VLSRFFSLLLPPPSSFFLTAAFSTIMAKRKATAEELRARAEFSGYARRAERKTVLEITKSIIRRLRGIKIRR
jgi:hypothetical protein